MNDDAVTLAVIVWLTFGILLVTLGAAAVVGYVRRRLADRRFLTVVAERRAEAAELRRLEQLDAAFADMVAGRPILPLDAYGSEAVRIAAREAGR